MDYDKIFGVDTSGEPTGDPGPEGPQGEREPEDAASESMTRTLPPSG